MNTQKLISDILDELEEYGKRKGILMGDGENYIPVSAAKMIVQKNATGVRYDWYDEKSKGDAG